LFLEKPSARARTRRLSISKPASLAASLCRPAVVPAHKWRRGTCGSRGRQILDPAAIKRPGQRHKWRSPCLQTPAGVSTHKLRPCGSWLPVFNALQPARGSPPVRGRPFADNAMNPCWTDGIWILSEFLNAFLTDHLPATPGRWRSAWREIATFRVGFAQKFLHSRLNRGSFFSLAIFSIP